MSTESAAADGPDPFAAISPLAEEESLASLPLNEILPPLTLAPIPSIAYVSGDLTPDSASWMNMGGAYAGRFSFEADINSGAISNGALRAVALRPGNNPATYHFYDLGGASGSMIGGVFIIKGFAGVHSGPFVANIAGGLTGPGTGYGEDAFMSGSGNMSSLGDAVSGTYGDLGSGFLTGLDSGTFSGSRQPTPPLTPILAQVSGSLSSATYATVTDFNGVFVFEVNMTSGAIDNALIKGNSVLSAIEYIAQGGKGVMTAGGNFIISDFTGAGAYGNYGSPAAQDLASSYMSGSGNVNNVGGSVSGNYSIDDRPSNFNVDYGTFSGSRTN
jgi:hypothetical protein